MPGRGWVAVVVALAVLAGQPAAAEPPARVRLVAELDDAAKARGLDVELSVPELGVVVVEAAAADVAQTAARLRAAGARRVEIDHRVRAAAHVDDPLWAQQWGARLVGAGDAWHRTDGAPTAVVAVLDTGVDTSHPDLRGAVVAEVDLENGDGRAEDDNGHGTQVAGIIAARAGNGIGISGHCPACALQAVRVLDADGVGDSSVVAAGILWAVDHGASIINLSLSSTSSSFVLAAAVEYALAHDVLVVVAAGNDGLVQPTYPASYPGVVGVVASDPTDSLYRWTNRGSWATVAAPGCQRATLEGGYADLCGTSAAAPAVSGVAAMLRTVAPDADVAALRAALATGPPVASTGTPRLDAVAAVKAALRAPSAPIEANGMTDGVPSAPRALQVHVENGSAVLSWSAPSSSGSSPIEEYVVTGHPSGATQSVAGDATTATIGGLVDGVTYHFRVAARNASGVGPPSELSSAVTPSSDRVARIAGAGRVLTAVALSQRSFAQADTVVLARADDHADALTAAPLAAQLGAPLLLVGRGGLAPELGAEIRRLGATTAYVIGGVGAVSNAVAAELATWGIEQVERIAGNDRFDTAARIAVEVGGTSVYIANGITGWPDAIAASALAATQGRPILLVTAGRIPSATQAALDALAVDAAVVLGGTVVIPDALAHALADPGGDGFEEVAVTRVAGADRYDTSRRIAELAVIAGADPSRAWLASGDSWPDALAAGPAVASRGGVLLLIRGDDLAASSSALGWLEDHGAALEEIVLVGGDASINQHAETQILRYMTR